MMYEFKGYPSPKKGWRFTKERLEQLDREGKIHYPKDPNGVPRLKSYLDEMPGVPLQTVWTDIRPLHNLASERLGYPTQKPLALLERIIKSSSNENDIVLACRVMAKRLRDVTRLPEDERLWRIGRGFVVRDLPQSEQQLRKMPPFEFENWAVIALGGIANKVQVGDMGLDGRIFPVSTTPAAKSGTLDFMDVWYPVQVKQKDKAGRPDIDSFEAAMIRSERTKGFFVSFDYSSDAITEIQRFFKQTGRVIVPLTVREILNDEIAMKLV